MGSEAHVIRLVQMSPDGRPAGPEVSDEEVGKEAAKAARNFLRRLGPV